jgi:hypothetical protein
LELEQPERSFLAPTAARFTRFAVGFGSDKLQCNLPLAGSNTPNHHTYLVGDAFYHNPTSGFGFGGWARAGERFSIWGGLSSFPDLISACSSTTKQAIADSTTVPSWYEYIHVVDCKKTFVNFISLLHSV